ncbi:MAG: OmpA family protein [Propionivibrio sp.]|nr:OmpA family protein [Propionivibrio sp.]
MTEAQVNEEYEQVLKAQPPKPSSFILYFVVGSSELTAESRAIVPQIVDRINAQVATEVHIIGHTDTTGSDEVNNKLALERAWWKRL